MAWGVDWPPHEPSHCVQVFLQVHEQLALGWLEDQFKKRAEVQFRLVLKEAKRVATTSGIGPNIVLYRALRDMLLVYPAYGVKASIMRHRAAELVVADQNCGRNSFRMDDGL